MERFSIVSDNCWGSGVYKEMQLEYCSPFINMFIHTPCFVKLSKNFKWYINQELTFIDPVSSIYSDVIHNFVTCRLFDVELFFSHYESVTDPVKDEVKRDWDRRLSRLNFDNIIFKCGGIYEDNCSMYENDMDRLIEEFSTIPRLPLITFTRKKYFLTNNFLIKKEHDRNAFVLGKSYSQYVEDIVPLFGKLPPQ